MDTLLGSSYVKLGIVIGIFHNRVAHRRQTLSFIRSILSQLIKATLIFILFIAFSASAAKRKRHAEPPADTSGDYVFALATADKFLHAWQVDDLETGMVLLSDHVRHSQDPEKFEQYFAGATDRAFEIAHGQGNRGRYSFAVVLVTTSGSHVRRRASAIMVVDSGKNDWVVDKLP